MDAEFLQARIDKTKELIVAYEDAILTLGSGAVQSYTLDTGQTRQTVTKMDIDALQRMLDSLYNRCATLEARKTGNNVVISTPGW